MGKWIVRNIERYTQLWRCAAGGNANGRRRTQKSQNRRAKAMGQGSGLRGDIYLLFYVEACHGLREHLSPLQPLSDRLKPVVAGIYKLEGSSPRVSALKNAGA